MRIAGELAQWVKHLPHKHEAMRIWVLILAGVSASAASACDPSTVAGAQTGNTQGLSVQLVQPK